jgi:hypothetical protein
MTQLWKSGHVNFKGRILVEQSNPLRVEID